MLWYVIWYFSPVLVYCGKKNLATLPVSGGLKNQDLCRMKPGPNPTILSYNAMSSLVRFENKNILSNYYKRRVLYDVTVL
jgi:hypothetical protein